MFTLSHSGHAAAVTDVTKFQVCNAVVVAWGRAEMT
jgi:hypothetical protein